MSLRDAINSVESIVIKQITSKTTPFRTFKTIKVAGQSDVVAAHDTDTLTIVEGANVTITTNGTNALTFASTDTDTDSNAFSTIAHAGQTSHPATSSAHTLTLDVDKGLQIDTNSGDGPVTFSLNIADSPHADPPVSGFYPIYYHPTLKSFVYKTT